MPSEREDPCADRPSPPLPVHLLGPGGKSDPGLSRITYDFCPTSNAPDRLGLGKLQIAASFSGMGGRSGLIFQDGASTSGSTYWVRLVVSGRTTAPPSPESTLSTLFVPRCEYPDLISGFSSLKSSPPAPFLTSWAVGWALRTLH